MENRIVFYTYILTAMAVIAGFVLIFLIHERDRQYRRKQLFDIAMIILGTFLINTIYFLSFFDSLSTTKEVYDPLSRGLDIFSSFLTNIFLYRLIIRRLAEKKPAFHKMLMPVTVFAGVVFLAAELSYLFLVDEEYRAVFVGTAGIPEAVQAVMTGTITGMSLLCMGLLLYVCNGRDLIHVLTAGVCLINVGLGVYNGYMSIRLFQGDYRYDRWTGGGDYNNILFLIEGILLFFIVLLYYRRMEAVDSSGAVPDWGRYGLTGREQEIAALMLQRKTYEEIAGELFISKYTVKRHVHNIYEKMEVSRRDEFSRKAKGRRS